MIKFRAAGLSAVFLLTFSGVAAAGPMSSLTSISSDGGPVSAVYVYSQADDTNQLTSFSGGGSTNLFCNRSGGGCSGGSAGQTVNLGTTSNLAFGLSDLSTGTSFRTNALGSDGYSHDMVSSTVNAGDAAAVAAAYALYGQGALSSVAAQAIAALAANGKTTVTFVGWEDRAGGDYDYNDLIFAFTNVQTFSSPADVATSFDTTNGANMDTITTGPGLGAQDPGGTDDLNLNKTTLDDAVRATFLDILAVPEPSTLGLFAMGLVALVSLRWRTRRSRPA
jgi:hypothetical protein